MSVLDRVESALEVVFEGIFTRVFRAPVQPAEIAKRLERSMETNPSVGIGKRYAPNSYEVSLSTRDFESFDRYRDSLEKELATYLQDRARDYRLTFISRPTVSIVPDQEVRRGSVKVRSWMQDPESSGGNSQFEFTQPIEIPRARRRETQSATLTVVS